jgi:hypothetical protein
LRTSAGGRRIGSQVSRCWSIYSLTDSLNHQWQAELGKIGSVFRNYMLIGSQWGFKTVGPSSVQGFLPQYMANTLVETYLQHAKDPGDSSCMACHIQATLPPENPPLPQPVPSDFSFLSGLAPVAGAPLIRRAPMQ